MLIRRLALCFGMRMWLAEKPVMSVLEKQSPPVPAVTECLVQAALLRWLTVGVVLPRRQFCSVRMLFVFAMGNSVVCSC